VMCCSWR